ncbi:NAD(P)-binding domain-containing protein [Actinomadura chokoriensis]|uniref:NAD(P)-binding domain-containing protein n=1 Tax=Actinomadura chokoriensis TaxID=454156 RepID=UPI003569C889
MTRIAFLGLGRMGAPMAGRLYAAGHDLTVWNRTPGRAAALPRAAQRATPPGSVGSGACPAAARSSAWRPTSAPRTRPSARGSSTRSRLRRTCWC